MPRKTACPFKLVDPEDPIREWIPLLGLGRAGRPGFGTSGIPVPFQAVRAWIHTVKTQGFRSILCLLTDEELKAYSHLPGGLQRAYDRAGFETEFLPVLPDTIGILDPGHRMGLEFAWRRLPGPLLVHCNVGQVRSGAALAHLREVADLGTTPCSVAEDREILRLIRNSSRRHAPCALRRGRFGMEDYGRLGQRLKSVPLADLDRYLGEIDQVRQTHQGCLPCTLKFLAFCQVFSRDRLPHHHAHYEAEFYRGLANHSGNRDFLTEIIAAIETTEFHRKPHPSPILQARVAFSKPSS